MVSIDDVRRLALQLPEAVEKAHHNISSFRVGDKIFATIPDDQHLHVMLSSEHIDMAISVMPQAFEELWWGKRLVGVRVNLSGAKLDLLGELLRIAWQNKAPSRLAKNSARSTE